MPKNRKRTARRPELTFKSRGKEIKNARVTKRLTESYPQTKKASQESKKLDEADDVKGQEEEAIIENNFDDEDHSLQGPEPVIQGIVIFPFFSSHSSGLLLDVIVCFQYPRMKIVGSR
jgi:hypothetical protein